LRGDPRISGVTEIEDSLRALKERIEALTQTRDRAQARAEIAQADVDAGMEVLQEFGVSSVEEAEAKIEEGRRKIDAAVQELLAQVQELEAQ